MTPPLGGMLSIRTSMEVALPDSTLRALTEERLEDAWALHAAKRYSGAYYIAGYSAECALKVCAIKRIETVTNQGFMPESSLLKNIYIHDLQKLVQSADLLSHLEKAKHSSPEFQGNWKTVSAWSEVARYKSWKEHDADDILLALTDASDGVLPWIKQFW